jgi:FAD/FMN-containing dehydrogenase
MLNSDVIDLSRFFGALKAAGFQGEIADGVGTRSVYSTDNSIYQVKPRAVLFPRCGNDINLIVALAASPDLGPIPLAPRGGGTGTNGQSLTQGVVVDTSRHMTVIEHLDLERGLVTVQPGVVLNQLNHYLRPFGVFFPPMVSTAIARFRQDLGLRSCNGRGSIKRPGLAGRRTSACGIGRIDAER